MLAPKVADVCNYSVLIGRLLAACDVCPGSAQCQVKWDTFFGSAAKSSFLPARVWRGTKTAGPSLCNRLSGALLQLASSNELMEMDSRFNAAGQRTAST